MKALLLAAILIGCTDKPIYGDAVKEIAEATCERYVRCGWTTIPTYQECVSSVIEYFCTRLDCDYPFSGMEEVVACTSNYKGAACEEILEPCKF